MKWCRGGQVAQHDVGFLRSIRPHKAKPPFRRDLQHLGRSVLRRAAGAPPETPPAPDVGSQARGPA
jgi:hypothetical protein